MSDKDDDIKTPRLPSSTIINGTWEDDNNGGQADDLGPSKSQRKRDARSLRDLGERLVELPAATYQSLPLPEGLREATDLARQLRQHGARRRQLQYIGKLLRRMDATPIQRALDRDEQQRANERRHERHIEQLTEALSAGDDQRLAALFDDYPQLDRQHTRQLVRDAVRERATTAHGGHASRHARRQLLRYLRSALAADADEESERGKLF